MPVNALFTGEPLSWQGFYDRFNVWGKQGAWQHLWLTSLHLHRRTLDLSSVQLDGSHMLAKNGGPAIGYQGRKAGRTTNTLFLADNQGLPLAVATPQAGNQHDTFELERVFAELCALLEAAERRLEGLFLNADKDFDVTALRQACAWRGIEANIPRNRRSADWQTDDDTPLDPELYRRRLVIERLNAWLDGFKALLSRHDTPARIRVDNGPEFISHVLQTWCQGQGIALQWIQPASPTQNANIERFNGSFRRKLLNAYPFASLRQVRE